MFYLLCETAETILNFDKFNIHNEPTKEINFNPLYLQPSRKVNNRYSSSKTYSSEMDRLKDILFFEKHKLPRHMPSGGDGLLSQHSILAKKSALVESEDEKSVRENTLK